MLSLIKKLFKFIGWCLLLPLNLWSYFVKIVFTPWRLFSAEGRQKIFQGAVKDIKDTPENLSRDIGFFRKMGLFKSIGARPSVSSKSAASPNTSSPKESKEQITPDSSGSVAALSSSQVDWYGKAVAVQGAVVTSQDGSVMSYIKKCEACGEGPNGSTQTSAPRKGETFQTTFTCFKCGNNQKLEIRGGG